MKDQLTFPLRKIGLRLVFSVATLLLLGLIPMKSSAQISMVDIGIFPSTVIPNGAEVVLVPTFNTTLSMTNIQFSIKWDASLGITITPGSPIYPYNLTQQGPVVTSGGYNYAVFASSPGNALNWLAGNEYVALTFTYSACTGFEIAADAWTLGNNGDYYVEILGWDNTGDIYNSPMVCIDPLPNLATNPSPSVGDTVYPNAGGQIAFGWEYHPNPLFKAPDSFRLGLFTASGWDIVATVPYVTGQTVYTNMYQTSFPPLTSVSWNVTPFNAQGDAAGVVMWSFLVGPSPLTVSMSNPVTICEGTSTQLMADPSGGVNPVFYAWTPTTGLNDPSLMMPTASPTVTTTYEVLVTDSWGHTVVGDVTVTVNPAPIAAITGNNAICLGECDTLTASGGVSYLWSDGLTTAQNVACPYHTDTYIVTVTDANNCSAVASFTITVNPAPSVFISSMPIFCVNDPVYTLVEGSPAGGTYSGPGVNSLTGTLNPAAAGVSGAHAVSYEYTDSNGCTGGSTQDFAVNDLPAVALPEADFCIDNLPVTLTSGTPSGGVYSGNGVVGGVFNPSIAGAGLHEIHYTYTDPLTNCSNIAVADYTVYALPTVLITQDVAICEGECTLLQASGGISYAWSNGATTASQTVCPMQTTVYTVTVTDVHGCTNTASVTVTVNPLPVVTIASFPGFCADVQSYELIEGSPAGGVYSGPYVSTGYFYPSAAGAGSYTILYTYTDLNGCTNSTENEATVYPLPVVTAVELQTSVDMTSWSPVSGSLGNGYSMCIDPSTPYNYLDINTMTVGGNSLLTTSFSQNGFYLNTTSLPAGYYAYWDGKNVNINSAAGTWQAFMWQIITGNEPMFYISFDGTDYTLVDGLQYLVGSTNPLRISSDYPAGTYLFSGTVTGENGCVSPSINVSLQMNSGPIVSAGSDETICFGECVSLTATGGVSYMWSTGSTSNVINACPSINTVYTVTATDQNACTNTASVSVFVNPLPVADAGQDVIICAGDCATLTASGGVSYAWSTGGATASITVCPTQVATYSVTVTDANGCTDVDDVTVDVSYLTNVSAGADQTICLGDPASLTATGGVSYLWSTGATTATISVSPIVNTQYSVTVSDAAGCQGMADVMVFVNPLPVASAGADQSVCDGNCATLTATGGNYYMWSTGDATASINVCPSLTTTFTVTVTDVNGCQDVDDVVVNVNPLPIAYAGADEAICIGGCVTLTAMGGVSYLWSNGDQTASMTVCPLQSTTYTVTVTDANGCVAIDDVLVTVNPLPNADAGANQAICVGDCATLTATGGVSYEWSTGEYTASITVCPTQNTVYNVTVTDINGCTATDEVDVIVNPAAIISQQPSDLAVNLGAQAIFSIGVSGASSYQWQVSQDGGNTWANLSDNLVFTGTNTANLVIGVTNISLDGYMFKVELGSPCGPSVVSNAAMLTIIPPAIAVIAPDITSCASQVVYPIVLVKGIGVGAISLTLNYDASVLVYDGFQNLHPALLNGFYTVVNPNANQVYFSWHSVTPLNIIYDTLVELLFHSPAGGTTQMTWDLTTPGNCEFSDVAANVLPATYYIGSTTAIPSPALTSQPGNVDIEEGQNANFSVTATNATHYQWQFSDDGGTSWFDLSNSSMYQGVTTATLNIYGVTVYMDEYLFRVIVGGTCLPNVTSNTGHLNVRPIITTTIGNIVQCADRVIVPIYVSHMYGVAGISLTLGFNPVVLNYVGLYSSHPGLIGGITNDNSSFGRVYLSWYSTTPIDLGDVLLFELEFTSIGGTSSLVWDMSAPEYNEFNDITSAIISSIFVNGSITVNPSPLAYNVTGGGEYCDGGTGVVVGLSGSQAGKSYALHLNGQPTGQTVIGTGSAISFGPQTAAGTYTVVSTNLTTLCEKMMNNSVQIFINPLPVINAGSDASILLGTSYFIDAMVSNGTPGYSYNWTPGGMITQDITVSPSSSTTYTVVVTDSKGCIDSDDVTITIYENTINGYVTYQNSVSTALPGVTLSLNDNSKAVVATAVTNAAGFYTFPPVPNGTYTIEAASTAPWGGVNSTDALVIMQHFIQLIQLSGLPLEAADVDASGYVNTTDAFNAARRFAKLINSFPAGDWVFETATIALDEDNYVAVDLDGLCFGDVNGSYIPTAKATTSLQLETGKNLQIMGGKEFMLPLTVNRSVEVGAISLVLHVPAGIQVSDIVTTSSSSDLVYQQVGSELRISWYNNRPMHLAKDEALVYLRISVDPTFTGVADFTLGQESELADGYAQVVENVSLIMPKLSTNKEGQQLSATNYPNPFSYSTVITYTLPQNSNVKIRVFNMLGEEVAVLRDAEQSAGTHTIEFQAGNLVPGIYQYRIETQDASITRSMIITN